MSTTRNQAELLPWWRFSRRRLNRRWVIGLSLTSILLAGFGLSSIHYHSMMSGNAKELHQFQSRAMVLDERLTMSARLAAASGDPHWEEHYRQAEAELDVTLKRTRTLLDSLLSARVAEAQRDIKETSQHNDALVALENQCFERLRAGDRTGAAAAVMSAEYDRLKASYADAVVRSDSAIERLVTQEITHTQRRAVVASAFLALLVSVVIGWMILAVRGRHEAALTERTVAAAHAEEALRREQALLQAIVECSPEGILAIDGAGNIRLANTALERMLGYGPGELVGQLATTIIPERFREMYHGDCEQVAAGGEPSMVGKPMELAALHRDGKEIPVEMILGTAKHDNEVLLTVSFRGIAERKAAELRMHRLAGAVEAADDAVVLTDLNGNVVQVNPAFSRITGYAADEAIGQTLRLLKSGRHPPEFYRLLWARITAGKTWTGRLVNRRKDGSLIHVAASISPVLNDDGRITGYVGIQRDVTDELERERDLETAARLDKLTGLPNRALLLDRLQDAIERAKRLPEYHFAVMFLDFDRFKIVNDSLGHEFGDRLLRAIAARLRESLRAGDSLSRSVEGTTVARLGGDEFVVLLDGIKKPEDAATVADRLLKTLEAPYQLGEHEVRQTASIGIVCSPVEYDKADEILRDADTAMYEAKARGKACFVMFDASMQTIVQNRLQIENDLRAAIGSDQFFLDYQPIVSLEDGEIRGVEALIRWNHPTRGLVMPGEFIPIAEETRLILPLSDWIFEQACTQFMKWRRQAPDRAPAYVSINLSRIQLDEQNLVEQIVRTVQRAGMEPGQLQLEVTESGIMQNREAAKKILGALKAAGILLAVDDFGTGHSSLSCLHEFSFDVLKIDRSFTINFNRGREFIALTHAVVTLAEYLGMTCVVEGVENRDQIAALQSMGCTCGQGFYFGKPMSADALIDGKWRDGYRAPAADPFVLSELIGR